MFGHKKKLNSSNACICSDIFEENAFQNCFCRCLKPNLDKDSFIIFLKSSKISSKSDTLKSGVDFGQIKNKFLEAFGVTVLKNKNVHIFFVAFPLFYEIHKI